MYNHIVANKRKTFLLITIFVGIILGLGYIAGHMTGYGWYGIIPAAILSLVMTLFSYYGGDKVALATSRAQEIARNDNPYLWRMVENLSIAQGMPMPRLYIIPEQAINAFATGRDPQHASVAVTLGAMQKLTNEELEGVLAHELSHVKNYDIRVMTIVIVLVGVIALLSDWMVRIQFFHGSNDRDKGLHPIFLVVGIVLMILTPIIAQLIQLAVSRSREYLADASGVLLTRYPEGLARALEKIAQDSQPLETANSATAHLYIANPFGNTRKWLSNLFSTHPPVEERIARLRNMGR
ncbi:M48 family metallopeptidase [Candidatus Uhrbacteria bacterium]|nr:M48 family metallopeptidase [Candidatus Uhrbacteria bacterium]